MNVASTGTTPTPFGFAGQHGYQNDSVTGLMRLGHRYYDASVGRFLSRDPIQDGYNWYAYCNNDPVNDVDPEGLQKSNDEEKKIYDRVVRELKPYYPHAGDPSLRDKFHNGPLKKLKQAMRKKLSDEGVRNDKGQPITNPTVPYEDLKDAMEDFLRDNKPVDRHANRGDRGSFNDGRTPMPSNPSTGKRIAIGGLAGALIYACEISGKGCFVEGTLVLMADGSRKPIEQVQVGETVLSWNKKERKIYPTQVIQSSQFPFQGAIVILMADDGNEIRTTENHPIYVPGTGFVAAVLLGKSRSCLGSYGTTVHVSKAASLSMGCIPVYNLVVKDNHNYFVGQNAICVHDMTKPIN